LNQISETLFIIADHGRGRKEGAEVAEGDEGDDLGRCGHPFPTS